MNWKGLFSKALPVALSYLVNGATPAYAELPRGNFVAVLDVVDHRPKGKLKADGLTAVRKSLEARLGEGGSWRIVPNVQIKSALHEKVKESYKGCYDEGCAIEIGKEVAAQKVITTQILPENGNCLVTSILYDLKTAASENTAYAVVPCNQDSLSRTVREYIAPALKGEKVTRPEAQSRVVSESKPEPRTESNPDLCFDYQKPLVGRWKVKEVVNPDRSVVKMDEREGGTISFRPDGTFDGEIRVESTEKSETWFEDIKGTYTVNKAEGRVSIKGWGSDKERCKILPEYPHVWAQRMDADLSNPCRIYLGHIPDAISIWLNGPPGGVEVFQIHLDRVYSKECSNRSNRK